MKKIGFNAIITILVALVCIGCTTGDAGTIPDSDTVIDTQSSTQTIEEDTTVSTEAPTATPTEESTAGPTEELTSVPTKPEMPAPETVTPEAGVNHGIDRDGTPKKYVTFRFDDGITQDERIMELLKKYNMDCATFYINSGLLGASWEWVGQQYDRPDVPHKRYTRSDIMGGIYDGFEIGSHTMTHPSLKNCNQSTVTREVENDAKAIARLVGYKPVGIAWPGGDTEWNDASIETILQTTTIRYGSCTTATYRFQLPTYFMKWYPTCGFADGNLMELAQQFIDAEPTEDMLFFVWGHGYEFDLFYSWDQLEAFIQLISEAADEDDSIVLVTNAEFYQLFKDEISAWKE